MQTAGIFVLMQMFGCAQRAVPQWMCYTEKATECRGGCDVLSYPGSGVGYVTNWSNAMLQSLRRYHCNTPKLSPRRRCVAVCVAGQTASWL